MAASGAARASFMLRRLLVLFAISGFSGLIYESVWSHYLKLILGHAAYAQSLVLCIFMGGMAIGAWLAGRYSERIRSALGAYALIEASIGALSLTFHVLFTAVSDLLYTTLIPALARPFAVQCVKLALCSGLILPQSILLGATFPLMSVGVIRLFPDQPGAALSSLYFSNSFGAAVGVLVSGFVLIPGVGLPSTLLIAGSLNIAVALAVWPVARVPAAALTQRTAAPPDDSIHGVLALAALLTGLASFCYEVGWIRMLSLVLGTTNQAFELMLSAFITGLALGSLYVKKRVEALPNALRFAGYVQLLMALCALCTLLIYGSTFDVMAWLLRGLAKSSEGYALFNLSSHALALGVMLPATFMAGMTLPLLTFTALRHGGSEASVGRIYAANTLGGIAGVLLAMHVIMPVLGTKWLIALGAMLDALLGVYLLRGPLRTLGAACVVLVCAAAASFIELDPRQTASGVYRSGDARVAAGSVTFNRDGKTATISVVETKTGHVRINTNGKPEASIVRESRVGTMDEATMTLAAALPLALRPHARDVGVIGFGSGITTHTFLGARTLRKVDTIEIEPAMIEGARAFGARNRRAYEDSRSHIFVDDAKAFFSSHSARYDIIVSEPSNPWVSGTASLFSEEFYRDVRRYLAPGGVLVQWLQLYETNLDNIASVFKALDREFTELSVWSSNDADLLFVATMDAQLPPASAWIFEESSLTLELQRLGLSGPGDLAARFLGDKRSLRALFGASSAPANSDFFPYLAHQAVRSRFLGEHSLAALTNLHTAPVPVLEAFQREPRVREEPWSLTPHFLATKRQRQALAMADRITGQQDALVPYESLLRVAYLASVLRDCTDTAPLPFALHELAYNVNSFVTPQRADALWRHVRAAPCSRQLPEVLQTWIGLYHAVGVRDYGAMREHAERLLVQHAVKADDERYVYALTAGLLGALESTGLQPAAAFMGRVAPGFKLSAQTPPELRLLVSMLQPARAKRGSH